MAKVSVRGELRQLEDLFASGTVAGMTDRELLDRFASGLSPASDTAFACADFAARTDGPGRLPPGA